MQAKGSEEITWPSFFSVAFFYFSHVLLYPVLQWQQMAANKLENYDLPSVQPMGYSLNNTTDNTKGWKEKIVLKKI